MTEAIIISSAILLILLWLGFKEADKEYMRCLCGKQPKHEVDFGVSYEKEPRSHRYNCYECGLISAAGRTESDAKELWHSMIRYYKKYGNKK